MANQSNASFSGRKTLAEGRAARTQSARGDEDPLIELARIVGAEDPFEDLFRSAQTGRTRDSAPVETAGAPLEGYTGEDALRDFQQDNIGFAASAEHEAAEDGFERDLRGRQSFDEVDDQWAGRAHTELSGDPYGEAVDGAEVWADYDDPGDQDESIPSSGFDRDVPFGVGALRPIRSDSLAAGAVDDGAGPNALAPLAFHQLDSESDPVESSSVRRRGGGLIAAVVLGMTGVAVVGAFSYWRMTAAPGSDGPPPVVRAETAPAKVVPSEPGGAEIAHQNKLVYDRVGGTGRPIEERIAQPSSESAGPLPPAARNATVVPPNALEPRRVRTVTVRPDGTIIAETPAPSISPVPLRMERGPATDTNASFEEAGALPTAEAPDPPETSGASEEPAIGAPAPAPRPRAVATTPIQVAAATGSGAPDVGPRGDAVPPIPVQSRAPISLAPPITSANVAPAGTPSASALAPTGEAWAVQLTSQRTEDQARAAYQSLQQRFPTILGSHQPQLAKADLGDKGVYYRVRLVMPDRNAAIQFCTSLKAAGGDCLVQKN